MKPILLLILLTLTFTAHSQQNKKDQLNAVQVISKTFFGNDTTYIYYLGDLILYETTIHNQTFNTTDTVMSTEDTIDVATGDSMVVKEVELSTISAEPDSIWITKKYFVYHKDSTYGYGYNPASIYDIKRRQVSEESVGYGINIPDTFFRIKADSTIWNHDKTDLKMVHIMPAKGEMPSGKVALYFTKNLNIRHSLAPKIDEQMKMKFYRIQYLVDEFFDKKSNTLVPAQTVMDIELREFKAVDNKVMKYFERYKIDIEESQ